ncbi:MAG: SsrA-binding protein SmpB [Chitinophagales bacterium]|nr:SsrA-binding protein SmpB [Chitinophagales bacterium]HAE14825.1 SsrA-binding protein [Bacteroidota bacterium]MCB9020832.1 SsrA-binding protein SmpB [Chitinophagales bacterium]MCB9031250.1 SsrA-binding protein SmpB [Chitinophagales bacterium]HAE35264.1 SsrA-binding protein [Bacteroidota bacterium]
MKPQQLNIRNKRAGFDFELIDRFTAGLALRGSEIKSVREGKASINEAYCLFKDDELWVRNMHIAEYDMATNWQHEPLRMRKLLLEKRELRKLLSKVKERGYTIIPLRVFMSDRGFAKMEIALARGKKSHDKRHSIKAKDEKRDLDRSLSKFR